MNEKILCVDDEPNVLAAFQRHLRKSFAIETAPGGEEGLAAIAAKGPYAVVVSDMRMPGMDGVQFLARVKQAAPGTVRIMLTGNADQATAIGAINEGAIFRFLTKPCSIEALARAIGDGVEQHRLMAAEKELLERTLSGSIRVLIEVLSLYDPKGFGRATELRELVRSVVRTLDLPGAWQIEIATLLAPIGSATVPSELNLKLESGAPLSAPENEILARVPEVGHDLIRRIPRLESVAKIVRYQYKRYDGSGFPRDDVAGAAIPLGARVTKILGDLLQAESAGRSRAQALEDLAARGGWYDPQLLARVVSCLAGTPSSSARRAADALRVGVGDLVVGQLLLSDVETTDGRLLIAAGHRISGPLLERVRNHMRLTGVREPIAIERPHVDASREPGSALPSPREALAHEVEP